ncbi:MAG TPA: ABC transporter permease [Gemmatimonadaceae bacterium]|nr:ABC transporter permease [Gemmatimonadaceae bacterium]
MPTLDDGERVPTWRRYLRFWRANPTGDVRDEVAFHIESAVEELVAAGMSREAARQMAKRKFGDVDGISETLQTLSQQRERDMTHAEWWDAIRNDVTFGLRQLRKSPVFTAIAVLTLALGIGATSAIFSVVYSVLLRPLPYAGADRILSFAQQNGPGSTWNLPFGNYGVWRSQATGFEALGATYGGPGTMTLTGVGDPAPIAATSASSEYWKAMFIPPVLGRYFTPEEDREGAPHVVVLSYALWQNRFGGDHNVLGRTLTLSGEVYTVIGVAPSAYLLYPPMEKLWLPLAPSSQRLADFSDHELTVYGRLKPGVPPATAVRQLTQIDTRLATEHPHSGYDGGVIATSLIDAVAGAQRSTLYMLLGAVGLVLLIACGNIANLLLARANVRRAEIAIRGALGATRGRIVAQLFVESLLLALGGGVVGLVVAIGAMRFLVSSPARIPRLQDATINGPVLAFALALSIVCAVVFGLVPAFRAARLDLQQTLRDGGRESRGAGRERLRKVLVVSELCVAQLLLIGAGLLIRSALLVQAVPVGFDTHDLLSIDISLPSAQYPERPRQEATLQQIESAIAAIPGVKSVGRTQVAPIHGFGWNWSAFREGSDGHDAGAASADMRAASLNYFSTLGLPLVRGRSFNTSDVANGPPVAIISRGLAMRLYGDADPIGRRIGNGGGKNPAWKEIVGVVADMHANGKLADPPLELYMPSTQYINGGQTFLVRGGLTVTTLLPAIRRAVGTVDPLLALSGIGTMDDDVEKKLAMSHFTTLLLTLLGATGLILAAVGVYGVIAYVVAQRTHELGVRMALGATQGGVKWLVVRQGLVLAVVGVTIGAGISLAAARLLSSMTFGITTHDPLTFGVVAAVLLSVAVLASYIPARRATRIDPLSALRGS